MNNIELSCTVNESLSTHYLIYKITNIINGKYYIGQHKTDDVFDDYMGSGKIILEAEDKYGLSAFTKTILFDFDNFDDMNNKEKELVQLSNCYPNDSMSYNLHIGGCGGSAKGKDNPIFGKKFTDEHKTKISIALTGKEKTDKHKKNLSIALTGKSSWNSMSVEQQEKTRKKLSVSNKKVVHTSEWNDNVSKGLLNRSDEEKAKTYQKFIFTSTHHTKDEQEKIFENRSQGQKARKRTNEEKEHLKAASQKMWKEQHDEMLEKRRQTYAKMPKEKIADINKRKGSGGKTRKINDCIKKLKAICPLLDYIDFPFEQYICIHKDKKTLKLYVIEQYLKTKNINIDLIPEIVWVTNGEENKKVSKYNIPYGYQLGLTQYKTKKEEYVD